MNKSEYSAVETNVNDEEADAGVDIKSPSLPRGKTVVNTLTDDRKAKCWSYIQYVSVFIICVTYFVYQLILFADTDTNQQISASIDPMQTVELPFFYVQASQPLSTINIGPYEHHPWNNGNNSEVSEPVCNIELFEHNTTHTLQPCQTQTLDYVYNEDTTKWTIIQHGTSMLIYPPYEETMKVNQWLLLTFTTKDSEGNQLFGLNPYSQDLYSQYLGYTDNDPESYRLFWFADNTHHLKNTHILELIESKRNIVEDWVRKAQQTIVASYQVYEIDVLHIDHFGDLQTKYSVNSIFNGPTQTTRSLMYNESEDSWYHETTIFVMANALETQTTIVFSQKLTFLDCVSKTGGIFGLVFPASGVILACLLSGFGLWKCRVQGVAPHAGLSDEEKRKVLTYLKEIKLV
eukprot:269604_1